MKTTTTTTWRVVRVNADGSTVATRAYSKGMAKRIRARALRQDPSLVLKLEQA